MKRREIPSNIGFYCDNTPEKWTIAWNSLVIKPRDLQGLLEYGSRILLSPQGQAFIAPNSAVVKLKYLTSNKAHPQSTRIKAPGFNTLAPGWRSSQGWWWWGVDMQEPQRGSDLPSILNLFQCLSDNMAMPACASWVVALHYSLDCSCDVAFLFLFSVYIWKHFQWLLLTMLFLLQDILWSRLP